ncbi:MAG: helix-turn-helix domain-containing protein [Bacteroidota bacterium]
MYQVFQASPLYQGIIDAFWTYSHEGLSHVHTLLPDACADIIIDLNVQQGFVSGVMSTFQCRTLEPTVHLIGIRFRAEQLSLLTQAPLHLTKDLRIDISELIPQFGEGILDKLNSSQSISQQLSILETSLATTLRNLSKEPDPLVWQLTREIRQANGHISIKQLSHSVGMGLRQVERRFKKGVGLSPKEYASVIRFCHTKDHIQQFPQKDLLEIALDMGFSDHAHMTHEFHRIAGTSPSGFR